MAENESMSSDYEAKPESLPSVEERLADLRPSRELLEFYRQKVAEYDDEYLSLIKKFETLRSSQEEQIKVENDLHQRENEIHELQKAMSDLQVFLMQEREHVIRLYSENDRLKLQQFEDSKKIQALLALMGGKSLTGFAGAGEVTYFHREPPARAVVEEVDASRSGGWPLGGAAGVDGQSSTRDTIPKMTLGESSLDPNRDTMSARGNGATKKKKTSARDVTSNFENETEAEVMRLKIKALQGQLEEQTRNAREQTDVLMEDRRVAQEESDARVKRSEIKLEAMQSKHNRIQELLQQTTKDLLTEKQNRRTAEREWMSEKDRLLRALDDARDRGYESDAVEEDEPHVAVDAGAGGDGPEVGGHCHSTMAPGLVSTMTARDMKQTADHGAQTLIPSLGALPPVPRRNFRNATGREPLRKSVRVVDAMMEQKEKQHQMEIEALQNQLIQANKLSEMYREQVIGVESELSRLREEDSMNRTVFKERSDNMGQRLQQAKERHAALERRRLLEAEGFKTDIRQLRNRLKDAEKQIYKLTISMPVAEGDDMAILKEVKVGAARAKKAQGEVNLLKAKIYGIEHQLKKM